MDPITHGLLGATVAKTAMWRRVPRGVGLIGALSAMAPDLDVFIWSPTQDRIAYQSSDDDRKIVILNIQDGSQQYYTGNTIDSWSPNGRYLLVSCEYDGQVIMVSRPIGPAPL